MQKKLVALAIAGLVSGAAFAQSNVTVYGIADMYVARATASGADSLTAINSGGQSGSRLGFKGVEDLGNGLKALFTLEYGLTVDGNTGVGSGAVGRQQFLGLTGDFGTAVAGRLQTAGYDFACATSAIAGSALDAYDKVKVNTLIQCGSNGRADNAFAYMSPNFNGMSFAWNHARVTEGTAIGEDTANLLTGVYAQGPVMARVLWSKISKDTTVAADDITEIGVVGSYDLGVAKLSGAYSSNKVSGQSKNNKWELSAALPVGAGAVVGQYAKNNIKTTAASDNTNAWTLAYVHNFSKRTNFYGGYTRVNNDGTAKLAAVVAPKNNDGTSSVVAAGIRHTF